MNKNKTKFLEYLLRLSLSVGFLSAVADRFGLWPEKNCVWGNWPNFVEYTQHLLSFLPSQWGEYLAYVATASEIVLGILLLIPYKTKWIANLSGILLLSFALSMMISLGYKAPLDYSVFTAMSAAFALGFIAKN